MILLYWLFVASTRQSEPRLFPLLRPKLCTTAKRSATMVLPFNFHLVWFTHSPVEFLNVVPEDVGEYRTFLSGMATFQPIVLIPIFGQQPRLCFPTYTLLSKILARSKNRWAVTNTLWYTYLARSKNRWDSSVPVQLPSLYAD